MTRRRTALLAVVLAGVLSGCSGDVGVDAGGAQNPQLGSVDPGPTGVFRVEDRAPAPVLDGTTLEGESFSTEDLRGEVVVVNFWAHWCAPCAGEMPNLVAVEEQTRDLGVRFVGVNIKDEEVAARTFERQYGVTWPSLYDQPGALLLRFRDLAPQTPPTTLVLDREGRVAARFIGGVTETQLLGPVQVIAQEQA